MENLRESVVNTLQGVVEMSVLSFSVQIKGHVEEGELPKDIVLTVQAASPEEAKMKAVEIAVKMGYKSISVMDIDLVKDSDWYTKNNLGSGQDFNGGHNDLDKVVPHSMVSKSVE